MTEILNISIFAFVVLALAAARITRLVTRDSIFGDLRSKFHDHYPPTGHYVTKPERFRLDVKDYVFRLKFVRPKQRAKYLPIYKSMPAGVGGEAERWYVTQGSFIGNLTSCDWCTGVWVSAAIFGLLFVSVNWTFILCLPFALAELVGLFAGHEG